MKEIKKEIIHREYQTVYVTADGTEFYNRDECDKYEKSAFGVLNARYMEFVVKTMTEDDLSKCGSCDCTVEVVKLTDSDDIDVVTQLYCLTHNYEKNNNQVIRIRELCKRAINTRDFLLICRGYEYDNMWVLDTLTGYLNYILKQCDPGSKIKIEDDENYVIDE